MGNSWARPPGRAIRVYLSRGLPAHYLRVAHEMDENAVNEWAELLADDAPRLNGRQTARLRRLFDSRVTYAGMRGQSLPIGESVPAPGAREVSRIEPDTG